MSLNEEFDELARRKLEGRQFAFQEADWQDARKQIDAGQGGLSPTVWITGAAVLVLMSGLVWYGTRTTHPEGAVANIEHVEARPEMAKAVAQEAPNTPALSAEETPSNTNAAALEDTNEPSISSTTAQSIPVHSKEEVPEAKSELNKPTKKNIPREIVDPNRTAQSTTIPLGTNVTYDTQVAAQSGPEPAAATTLEVATTAAAQDAPAPASNPTVSTVQETAAQPSQASAEATTATEPDRAGQAESLGKAAITVAGTQGTTSTSLSQTNTADATPGATTGSESSMAASGTMPPAEPSNAIVAAQGTPEETAAPTSSVTTASVTEVPSTATTTTPTAPEDSINAAAAAAATAPPLVPARAPWEVSIFGGMLSSTTKYSGSNSADWKGDIGKENSLGIGAELVHMGRNFGIGTGLHYSVYAEQLRTDAVDHSTTTLQNFWYLMPLDTMIFVVTDTIPGTPPSYMGTSTSTTVDVLTQGTDTTTTTERIREARNEVNHVSYLEVPLLLDAHLVQGRWSFGLRGGPTIGLLTGRRGTLPAPDNEGYVAFTDMPFRELIIGYSARAYARYRFNAAWSVGIEPVMQGQLMNSLGSGELERKVNAKGVMLSLSYRLR